jgi:hypothetical protein
MTSVASQSAGYKLTLDTGSTTRTSDLVVGQQGSVVGVLELTPEPSAGPTSLAQIAKAAYDRISS